MHKMAFSMDKKKINILLLEGVHEKAVDVFTKDGYTNVTRHSKALEGQDLLNAVADAHIIGLRSRTQITADVLAHASKLFAIGCFCIGTNQVNMDAARRRGIPVFNAPFSNTRSVAELVIAEMIMLMRGIPQKNMALHLSGEWMKSAENAHEVRGKTLGIVGYGHIGIQVSSIAEALGMNVIYYDIVNKLCLGNARVADSLKELLEVSDVVSLHVPADETTANMINEKTLAYMKEGAHLINASRGTVVDIPELVKVLESGKLSGAAIDVFPEEPKSKNDIFQSDLRNMPNVILTPHIGGSTLEAQENIGLEVADKMIKYSNNGTTISAVNFAEVSLPQHTGKRRILHIHKNVPGMLMKLNELFSSMGLNIAAQYLQTHEDIGYVVTDIETEDDIPLEAINNLEGTIRSRVLY
jgi:D-3-phosphoglycerate dehydrogenase